MMCWRLGVVLPDIENNEDELDAKDGKCHVCIKNFRGMDDKERRRQKGNLNKMKKKCNNYKKKQHVPIIVLKSGFLCERCSPS